MAGKNLLEVDPSIVERNLRFTDSIDDELQHLFPASKQEIPSKLVKPTPGFCVKTRLDTNDKIFINICQTDAIPPPDDISDEKLIEILKSDNPSEFRVPMSIADGRPEIDKSGNAATAYDIAIHPLFFQKIENNKLFKQFFLTIVFEGLQDKYRININVEDFTILKNRKAVGNLQMHRIQQREIDKKMNREKKLIEELDSKINPLIEDFKQKQEENSKECPYRLVRMIQGDRQCFVGDFFMPDIISPKELTLDVGEDRIIIECRKKGYLVDIFLPQLINQNTINAKLNKNNGILTITMPIVRC